MIYVSCYRIYIITLHLHPQYFYMKSQAILSNACSKQRQLACPPLLKERHASKQKLKPFSSLMSHKRLCNRRKTGDFVMRLNFTTCSVIRKRRACDLQAQNLSRALPRKQPAVSCGCKALCGWDLSVPFKPHEPPVKFFL